MKSLVEERPRAAFLADILKALAHPARLRIVAALCEGEENVIGLAERLDIPQAIVSQQLRILRMSGLVAAVRIKGYARYGLAQPRLRELIACLEGCHAESPGSSRATCAKVGSALTRTSCRADSPITIPAR